MVFQPSVSFLGGRISGNKFFMQRESRGVLQKFSLSFPNFNTRENKGKKILNFSSFSTYLYNLPNRRGWGHVYDIVARVEIFKKLNLH